MELGRPLLQDSSSSAESPEVEPPIDRFGVVGAMSKNRIIGMNGKIPWSIPEDRCNFKRLTNNTVLVVGRKTYEEEEDECHISHASWCIVISKTADEERLGSSKRVKVVRSFSEALSLARSLVAAQDEQPGETAVTQCWVAGGETVYEEALRHPSATEVHLTVVDTEINPAGDEETQSLARFPAKYRWDRHFRQTSKAVFEANESRPHSFTSYVFERRRRPSSQTK